MSMISDLIRELKQTADAHKPTNEYLFKLLSEASETISDLSAKLHSRNMQNSSNYYQGKRAFLVKVNNIPVTLDDKYIVVRKDHTELWYYGEYDNEDFAYKVAEEIGNGIVIERIE